MSPTPQPTPEQEAERLYFDLLSVNQETLQKAIAQLTAIITENRELQREVRQNQLEDEKFLKLTQERDAAIRERDELRDNYDKAVNEAAKSISDTANRAIDSFRAKADFLLESLNYVLSYVDLDTVEMDFIRQRLAAVNAARNQK